MEPIAALDIEQSELSLKVDFIGDADPNLVVDQKHGRARF